MYGYMHATELYEYGTVVALAVNDPKRLKKVRPGSELKLEDVHPILRPAKSG